MKLMILAVAAAALTPIAPASAQGHGYYGHRSHGYGYHGYRPRYGHRRGYGYGYRGDGYYRQRSDDGYGSSECRVRQTYNGVVRRCFYR